MDPSIIIVGAGTFGTSTAFRLAQSYNDASKVTIIDQFPSSPKDAASTDVNRIVRTDYPNPLYCKLAFEAIHGWYWDIELAPFFRKSGWLMMDEKGSNLSDRVLKAFKDRGSTQTDDVPLDKLSERWESLKGTETEGFQSAYWNPEAGWCDATGATAAYMAAAEKKGVKRVTGRVTELLLDADGGRIEGVRTADGTRFTADKIVLATGAWTSSLLSPIEDSLDIPEQDRVERQVQAIGRVSAYYKLSGEQVEDLHKSKTPIVVYGRRGEMIPPSRDNKILKYNNSNRDMAVTNTTTTQSGKKISVPPPNRSQNLVPKKLQQETEALVTSKIIPEFSRGKQADFWRIAWDAQTPTNDFLLCKHPRPQLANLYLAVGGSFHSYKFLPNIGNYVVNVLNAKSNGAEKDEAWCWKSGADWTDAQEQAVVKRELKDLEDEKSPSVGESKL